MQPSSHPTDAPGSSFRAPFGGVVIASSLGGLTVLEQVLEDLPADFPVPIVAVHHVGSRHPSQLPDVLRRRSAMEVVHPVSGEAPRPGVVYVAPSDHHLILSTDGTFRLDRGPRIRFVRPAADVLFISAARYFGARTLGLVFSGKLDDGARGVSAIRGRSGAVIAQHPATCLAPDMPRAAIRAGAQFVLEPKAIAAAIVALVTCAGVAAMFGLERSEEAA